MQKHFIEDLLFQQDINAVLKKTNLSTMEKDKQASIKKKALNTIQLAIAHEIKYKQLKEIDPIVLLKKLSFGWNFY